MKYLFTLLISMPILACEMSIPLSYVPTFMNPPVSGHYMKCDARPDEQCVCIDGVSPYYAALVDEVDENGQPNGLKKLINDGVKRDIYLAQEAAKIAVEKSKEEKKAIAKAKLKALKKADMNSANTIAKLKDIVQVLLDSEVGELND